MTLKPTDMLEIQSAIDAYERKFPRRPAPTAEVALAWRLGKKEWARRQAAERAREATSEQLEAGVDDELKAPVEPVSSRVPRQRRQIRLRWQTPGIFSESGENFGEERSQGSNPWVRSVLRVGLWGVLAVLVASVFMLGAIAGGFK
jgi:hypothetical protein